MNPSSKARWGKRILWTLIGLLGLMSLPILYLWRNAPAALLTNPLEPPAMAAAHYATRDVVGDLGGMPVTIPRHFADFVEYDDDPGWGEKRSSPRPERTHASRIRSFGFYARFPDMAGLSSAEMYQHQQSQTIYNSTWLLVGLHAGQDYPGDGGLDRLTTGMLRMGSPVPYEQYEKLPETFNGLTFYAPAGIDPKTNKPYREHTHAHDIFVHENKDGHVDTYISCSNRPHGAATCEQSMSLEPDVKAKVSVIYRRGLLPEWQQIQSSVKQRILGFREASLAQPTTTPTSSSR